MGSRSADFWRNQYPGKTDTEIGAEMGREGFGVVVRYKSSRGGDYDQFGTCHNEEMVAAYFTSPYCHALRSCTSLPGHKAGYVMPRNDENRLDLFYQSPAYHPREMSRIFPMLG
ncbi:MAG: hypothetical protein ACLQPD_19025 [Desulfomonilaceae bacterium]